MTIALDGITTGSAGPNAAPPQSFSFNHTLGGGSNRAVVVSVAIEYGNSPTNPRVSGVTYNGTTMTAGPSVSVNPGGVAGEVAAIFYLLEASLPAAGTYSVQVTATDDNAVNVAQLVAACFSFTGVSQSGQPDATNTSTTTTGGSSYSTGITTVADNAWIIDALADGNATSAAPTANAGQANLQNVNGGGTGNALIASTKAVTPAGATTVGYTAIIPSYNRLAHALISLAPDAGGGGAAMAPAAVARRTQRVPRTGRTRATSPLAAQDPAPASVEPPRRPRVVRPPRPRAWTPVRAQVPVPPTIPSHRTAQPRRLRGAPVRRAKRWMPIPPQVPVPPTIPSPMVQQKRRQRGWLLRRGRRNWPVPTAVVAPTNPAFAPATVDAARRQKLWPVRRRTSSVPLASPDLPPSTVDPARRPRLLLLRRWRATSVVPAQIPVPPTLPTTTVQPRRVRGWRLVRGRRVMPIPPQVPVPPTIPSPMVQQRRRQRGWRLARGPRAVPLVDTTSSPSVAQRSSPRPRIRTWLRRARSWFVPGSITRGPVRDIDYELGVPFVSWSTDQPATTWSTSSPFVAWSAAPPEIDWLDTDPRGSWRAGEPET